jgi:hypothetical protein
MDSQLKYSQKMKAIQTNQNKKKMENPHIAEKTWSKNIHNSWKSSKKLIETHHSDMGTNARDTRRNPAQACGSIRNPCS